MCEDKRERVILILKNMAKRETGKREETADVTAQVLEELSELRQEVRLAIEAASMPHSALSCATVPCSTKPSGIPVFVISAPE